MMITYTANKARNPKLIVNVLHLVTTWHKATAKPEAGLAVLSLPSHLPGTSVDDIHFGGVYFPINGDWH